MRTVTAFILGFALAWLVTTQFLGKEHKVQAKPQTGSVSKPLKGANLTKDKENPITPDSTIQALVKKNAELKEEIKQDEEAINNLRTENNEIRDQAIAFNNACITNSDDFNKKGAADPKWMNCRSHWLTFFGLFQESY
jgi:cell division protein FtsB